jgi:hypothetical protein
MLEQPKNKPAKLFKWLVGSSDAEKQALNDLAKAESNESLADQLLQVSQQIKQLQQAKETLQQALLERLEWKKGTRQVNTLHLGKFTVKRTPSYRLTMPYGFDIEAFAERQPNYVKLSVNRDKVAKHIIETGDALGLDGEGFSTGIAYAVSVALQS